jgi:hypothetical protein
MKARSVVVIDPPHVEINLTLEKPADAGAAMETIRNLARACWPAIVFNDESDSSDQRNESWLEETPPLPTEAKPTRAEPRRSNSKRDYTRPPKEGSLGAKVIEACRRLNTTDFTAIADDLDLKSGTAAALIANLKRGGHLGEGALQ